MPRKKPQIKPKPNPHHRHISILWDFDGTLASEDSTSNFITKALKINEKDFWEDVRRLRGEDYSGQKQRLEFLLSSDAPIWMYLVSEYAGQRDIPLNRTYFDGETKDKKLHIKLYPRVLKFLEGIKSLEREARFKKQNLKIKHFVITAGLEDLVSSLLKESENLIERVFGCKYKVQYEGQEAESQSKKAVKNIPIFCMDQTMKTRSIFEISKGVIFYKNRKLNQKFEEKDLWCPLENMIYIGDGPTDIPSLSLIRRNGGMGIVVYDPVKGSTNRIKVLRKGNRADLITQANFSKSHELYKFIHARCLQICQKYEARYQEKV